MKTIMGEKYYTIKEVAKILELSYSAVWTWINRGKLKAYKLGSQYLIKQKSIDQLLEEVKPAKAE